MTDYDDQWTDVEIPAKEHPAKFSDSLLLTLEKALVGYEKILDPFAGTGKIRTVRPDCYLLEIEPEWAAIRKAAVGDAHAMPWPDGCFDAVVTSPTYGNRMADHHNARDGSKRNTYRHTLGRELSPNNSGALQWGPAYRMFHYKAWQEVRRVLRPDGRFVLNISDHIRKGKLVPVTHFHILLLVMMGFDFIKHHQIETKRQRQGANGALRSQYESVLIFQKIKLEPPTFLTFEMERLWPDMKGIPDGNDPFPNYPISGQE